MKRKIVIGVLVPVMAALGLYLGTGAATAQSNHTATVQNEVSSSVGTESENRSGTESDGPDGTTETEEQGGTESEGAGGTESEGAADTAAQHADCLKAGIDDTVTPDVQYDDQTGSCSLDTGTDNEGGD